MREVYVALPSCPRAKSRHNGQMEISTEQRRAAHSGSVARPALYVVATPIGNRGDITDRAVATLSAVDVIAAEDTRVSGPLVRDLGATARLVSLHEHNEEQRVPQVLTWLGEGKAVALISDAGTPLISDPGFVLVRAVRDAGFPVISVPGACAAVAALSISGLPTDQFMFAGFVANKPAARRSQFDALRDVGATMIFYASKRQLGDALAAAGEVFGVDRPAVIARELTKLHETVHSGTLGELGDAWPTLEPRGEWVLIIGGRIEHNVAQAELERIMTALLPRLSVRDAAATAAEILGVSKRDAYACGLTLKET
ncbi:MAG: 16S rRNA (cytidine(1402)-2'-O)-methyltransferase [Pseudomonadota bacterium]